MMPSRRSCATSARRAWARHRAVGADGDRSASAVRRRWAPVPAGGGRAGASTFVVAASSGQRRAVAQAPIRIDAAPALRSGVAPADDVARSGPTATLEVVCARHSSVAQLRRAGRSRGGEVLGDGHRASSAFTDGEVEVVAGCRQTGIALDIGACSAESGIVAEAFEVQRFYAETARCSRRRSPIQASSGRPPLRPFIADLALHRRGRGTE